MAQSAGAIRYTDCTSADGVWPTTNECPVMTLRILIGSSNDGALGSAEYSFIAIAPRSTLPGVVAPDRALSMDQIELNSGFLSLLFLAF